MSKTRWIIFAFAAVAMLAAPHVTFAQDDGAQYLIVHFDQVEPTQTGPFEENAKTWVSEFTKHKMGPEWTWLGYSNAEFTYAWVSPMPNFAFLDASEERETMADELSEETVKKLMSGNEYITSHRQEILKAEPELSYAPKEPLSSEPNFTFVGTHHVKPAMDDKFRDLVKRVVAAFEKVEAPLGFTAYSVPFGEGSYIFVSSADSASQLYANQKTGEHLAKAVGPEAAAAMFQEWAECISGYETMNWNYEKDLSFVPGAAPEGGDEAGG